MEGWADKFGFPEEGMKMTQQYEGFKSSPYTDTRGVPTIGYGFNMNTNKGLPNPMTREQAQPILQQQYSKAVNDAINYSGEQWYALSPQQQMIIVDMAYNLGGAGLGGFKDMQANIKSLNFKDVPNDMKNSNWYGQVGNRSKEHIQNWNK